jgi:hypothetical protein
LQSRGGWLHGGNYDAYLASLQDRARNSESMALPESDLMAIARERFLPMLSPQEQLASGGARAPGDWRAGMPAGWADVAVDQQNRVGWGVDASGRIIPGSHFSLATNDDRFGIAATLAFAGMGAAAAGAGAGTAAAGAEAGTGTAAAGAEAGAASGAYATGDLGALGGAGGGGASAAAAAEGSAAAAPAASAAAGGGEGSLGLRDYYNIMSGLYGLYQGERVADRMDPFGPHRGYFAERLMELERNPGLITSRPGYRAGLEAITREMASKGYLGSGNQMVALSRYAGDFYNQEANRLAQLAGAGAAPGGGELARAGLQGQGLASIAYGLAPYTTNRPQTGIGGSYYGGGYGQYPVSDPEGRNSMGG